jgi:UDPglucose--hexose-1-phosphate uridylyltransferase
VSELRVDPVLGTRVHVVGTRQGRPNLPSTGCPFCVGGVEAPEPYDVRWFPNRWPAMDGERCEVVLYTSDHDATFWSLGVDGIRRVIDLWADRTQALGSRDDVDHVLVFENRGPEVGATIAHPHGQIYAYPHVPERPARRLAGGWTPDADPGDRAVVSHGTWNAWVPWATTFPVELALAPSERVGSLLELDDTSRNDLATLLADVLERLDHLFDQPLPYMMWLNQRPTVNDPHRRADYADAWFNIELVSPWRSPGVPRFIAAAEVACQEFFNPLVPEDLAARLRASAPTADRARAGATDGHG